MKIQRLICHGLVALVALLLAGCVTTPSPQGETYSARYVGDRDTLSLDEFVFTIQLQDGPTTRLQNVHVRFSVIVNPKDVSLASIYDATGIIRNTEPRIRARLADFVQVGKTVALNEMAALKNSIASEAQATLDVTYFKWKNARAYEAKIAVGAFYLTDLSVGATTTTRSWW